MNRNTAIGLAILPAAALVLWGVTSFSKHAARSKAKQSLEALGQAQTVYSGARDDVYQTPDGQGAEESFKADGERMDSPFYAFTLNDIDGVPVQLSQYRGQVLLVVNVASRCGYTKQYADLQRLYETYKERGFAVLGFPANDFLSQEPGTDAEIKNFCTTRFQVTFPMFSRISVKGDDMHPLYRYLTDPEANGEFGRPVQWNFNKFLIDSHGKTIGYFESKAAPLDPQITDAVEKALAELDAI